MVSADPGLTAACLTVFTASEILALKPYRVNPLYGIFSEVMETSASFKARSGLLPYPTRLTEGFRCRCREHPPLEHVAPVEACLQLSWGAPKGTRTLAAAVDSISSNVHPQREFTCAVEPLAQRSHRRPPTCLRSRSRRSLAISICLKATRSLFQRLARSGSGIFGFP